MPFVIEDLLKARGAHQLARGYARSTPLAIAICAKCPRNYRNYPFTEGRLAHNVL